MQIYCCACAEDIEARLTDGSEIYPHRPDLASIPFWKCDSCGNSVGCHHKTKDRTKPLGVIPSPEIREARKHLHSVIDPIWQNNLMSRKRVYRAIADAIGIKEYHTAEIRDIEQARAAYRAAASIREDLQSPP